MSTHNGCKKWIHNISEVRDWTRGYYKNKLYEYVVDGMAQVQELAVLNIQILLSQIWLVG
jgi:hypothetical protein